MGILPDIEFGNDCLACWGAGLTPKYIYLSISEMQAGNLWLPTDPPPPNGIWKLTQRPAPCEWLYFIWPWQWFYDTALPGSAIEGTYEIADQVFQKGIPVNCTHAFTNNINFPAGSHYYGGKAQVSFTG